MLSKVMVEIKDGVPAIGRRPSCYVDNPVNSVKTWCVKKNNVERDRLSFFRSIFAVWLREHSDNTEIIFS